MAETGSNQVDIYIFRCHTGICVTRMTTTISSKAKQKGRDVTKETYSVVDSLEAQKIMITSKRFRHIDGPTDIQTKF